ncbi:fumarylacetoacetate hydrolase family protein (plasmid) [Mycolicibacterium psychrotolerans]|uniref:fumarylacetoacetate hydrolase family protein n=1 Tax=Mycolicibacterium psychrotolerans TaxID=216929 RepID=UPI003D6746A1
MKIGVRQNELVGYDEPNRRWVELDTPTDNGVVGLLSAGPHALTHAAQHIDRDACGPSGPPTDLPLAPTSLRDFSLWERHMIDAARGMVTQFAPAAARIVMRGYETVAKRTFPPLRPKPNFARTPQFYFGNHRSVHPDGAVIDWPRYSTWLDFELELGVIMARPVRDCTPAEGLAAVGGFVVLNDCTARDVQWNDLRGSSFGGMVKAKSFATAIGLVVVTAEEILPIWEDLHGEVLVNGEKWCTGSSRNPTHSIGDMIAYAAAGETIEAGALLGTGTFPGCSGIELNRRLQPGDTVECRIDRIGSVTTTYGQPAR